MRKPYFWKFIITVAFLAISTVTAQAITLSASTNPAVTNETVTFRINVALSVNLPLAACNIFLNFGDGRAAVALGSVSTTTPVVFEATHTYSQSGVYTVTAYSSSDCNPIVVKPNPAYLSLRVSDLEVKRIELLFDNGKPQITLQKNDPAPRLTAKINFSGSEFLKGYWEVDGNQTQYFFKQLSIGPEAIIEYPKIPGIKTFEPGSHIIRFVITQPDLDIIFPRVVYYVKPEPYIRVVDIHFTSPGKNEPNRIDSNQVSWQTVPDTKVYMIHLFEKGEDVPVFSAYAVQSAYIFRKDIMNRFIKPDKEYLIEVEGFHEDTRLTGKSRKIPIRIQ